MNRQKLCNAGVSSGKNGDTMRLVKGLLKITLYVVSLAMCAAILCGGFFAVKGYNMYKTAIEQRSIEDRVAELTSMDNYIEYERLPDIYIDAVVSVEDHRYFSHRGIDLIAIARAALHDIQAMSFVEGGSTITQQLAKNMLFTQDQNFERKFAEIFAAFKLEKMYSKEDILEMYINSIYYGSGYYGIYDASQGYYGKSPWELTDFECVMLAGLPNAPSVYSPDENYELALQRMKQVLKKMVEYGFLSDSEAAFLAG